MQLLCNWYAVRVLLRCSLYAVAMQLLCRFYACREGVSHTCMHNKFSDTLSAEQHPRVADHPACIAGHVRSSRVPDALGLVQPA